MVLEILCGLSFAMSAFSLLLAFHAWMRAVQQGFVAGMKHAQDECMKDGHNHQLVYRGNVSGKGGL